MDGTYEADVRAGDVVRGADGNEWGVREISRAPGLAVTLERGGVRIVGYPPAGTPVEIVARAAVPAPVSVEAAAMAALQSAGLGPLLLREVWEE